MGQDSSSSRRSSSQAPKESRQRSANKPGVFTGWISKKWGVAWVVSPHRVDKRAGWINRTHEGG